MSTNPENEIIVSGTPGRGKTYRNISKVQSVPSNVFITHMKTWDGTLHNAQEIVTWLNTMYEHEENPAHCVNGCIVINIEGQTQYLLPHEPIEIHTTLERYRMDKIHSQ